MVETPSPCTERCVRAGFKFGDTGSHNSRTMMLEEMVRCLDVLPPGARRTDYRTAIVDRNILGKSTESTRKECFRRLRELYALEPDVPLFAIADGIVCLNAIKGEQSAAERLRVLLAAAFGRGWSATTQAELLAQAGYAGKTLEEWLRNGFVEQHCQLFRQRPFIWQVWDGLRDGFSVLVNYHRLDRRVLEKLIYVYLGDWIARQEAAVAAGEEGIDAKLAAAQELKAGLEKILEGEGYPDRNRGHDIFVRWKPLEKQPIGCDPDLNDGVRLNIRPFVEAGFLRRTPKINWGRTAVGMSPVPRGIRSSKATASMTTI